MYCTSVLHYVLKAFIVNAKTMFMMYKHYLSNSYTTAVRDFADIYTRTLRATGPMGEGVRLYQQIRM